MEKKYFSCLVVVCVLFSCHGKVFFYDLDNDSYRSIDSKKNDSKQRNAKNSVSNSFSGKRVSDSKPKTCKTYLAEDRLYEVKPYSSMNNSKNKPVRNTMNQSKKNVESTANVSKLNNDLISENNRLIRENTRLLRENSKLSCEVREALADLKKRLDEYEKQ